MLARFPPAMLEQLNYTHELKYTIWLAGLLLSFLLCRFLLKYWEPVSPDIPFVGPRGRQLVATPELDVAHLKEGFAMV